MAKWEELPIADRAQYMRLAVQNGYRDIRSIREAYNIYAEGGTKGGPEDEYNKWLENEAILRNERGRRFRDYREPEETYIEGVLPTITINRRRFDNGGNTRNKSIKRANYVASNYDDAIDFEMNPIIYMARKTAKNLIDRGGLSNCTLSATQWIDPSNPYMSARNIFNNPNSGYTEISADEALPGDLLITKNPKHNTYHTMLIEGFDKNNQPLLRYSKGGHNTEKNLVTSRALKDYHIMDKTQGGNHTEDHYFRYNYPDEHWLPELVVTPKREQ